MKEKQMAVDLEVRLAAFRWLEETTRVYSPYIPREVLLAGFEFQGKRVPLVGPPGIFKPAILSTVPLSITTAPKGPYDDDIGDGDVISYRYRGTDPHHPDNVGLRVALRDQVPLVYFFGVAPGKYLASWPVYVVGDDPKALTFRVAVDDSLAVLTANTSRPEQPELRRAYITRQVQQRLHQHNFRQRVLEAYREQCAFCKLRHAELLDAAHIVPDSHPQGKPIVTNGLALCKLHHAAYDTNLVAVSPSYKIEVRPDILDEEDGPMLLHGLQGIHGRSIILPTRKEFYPDSSLLELRYDQFRKAV